MQALTVDEKIELSHLEAAIEQGRQGFQRSAIALKSVYDKNLWREFDSFKDYWQDKWAARWGFDWNYAYKLVEAAEVLENLAGCTTVQLINERQTRPLKALEPTEQLQAVEAAAAIAPDHQPNSTHIARAATAVKAAPASTLQQGQQVEVLDETSPYYRQTVTIARIDGAIAHCETDAGEAPLLISEIQPPRPTPSTPPAAKPPLQSEILSARLSVAQERLEIIEAVLTEAIALLKTHAASVPAVQSWLGENESLLA